MNKIDASESDPNHNEQSSSKTITEGNAVKYTLILIALTFVVRVLIGAYTGLGIGESYYFRGAVTLSLSYFDQPPLFFWLSGIMIKLFGLSNLTLRLPAIILFAGTSWLLFLITRKFFNARSGFWAVLIMNLSAVFTIPVATWFQPDAPLMFFWLLATYFIIQLLMPNANAKPRTTAQEYGLWTLVGVFMGLATLSKYHVLFLFVGVLMFIIANKAQRRWLTHGGPYLAVLITLIIASPILWWNAHNNWVSFAFQGSRAVSDGKFVLHPDWFLRSFIGQACWILPWIWLPVMKQLFQSFKQRNSSLPYSFVFWTSVLPIIFFTVITLWADLQYHFHWQAPGYLMLFIPVGYAIDKNLSDPARARGTRRWLRFSASFTLITIAFLSLHMITGFWQWYGPKYIVTHTHLGIDDPTIEGTDYLDIKARFEKEGWMKNPKLFAGCTRWWLTGKVDWALKGQKPIVCFSFDPRNLAFLVDPGTLKGYDAVVIMQNDTTSLYQDVTPFFAKVKRVPDIIITRNGREEVHLATYYCTHFQLPKSPRGDLPVYYQLKGLPPFGHSLNGKD
ncbi:dolichyl-phosphate-mannose-protein mannosyltransferase [Mucilaginibacter gracilis]|uniref:Dolichyl-phosphate-mannose-protein mannosyltransferase n=1 Tax=Mucilaginibacter gracilis TaxID=423350 RepID=A0A495J320_9SPHI|nr:glycosyltransferase family 39 protein [Mucilaginibacter gracilis]RKR83022.1 dolichyl-phosphate-mannose-protein mannosyltransferase [Mucilaginibacter gracilis]